MGGMPVDAFRAHFPIFRRRVYVNSCSQGALSTEVEGAMRTFAESWHEAGSPWDRWMEEVERLRAAIASAIGADADEVAIMPSASIAIASIATALPFDSERSKVVLGEFEFPTMAHGWLAQRERGAQVGWVRAVGEELPLEAYAAEVDHRTRVVPVAHVCFRNGYRADVAGLVALCHERGALVFLDDYQRTGTARLDVHGLGVDFFVTGALKYLLGPSGVAFLYVRRALIERLTPLVTGWFGREQPFAFSSEPLDWSATARRFETGTPPIPNVYAARAGIDLLQSVGFDAIAGRINSLADRFMTGAHARGFALLTPDNPGRRGPLVVVRSTSAGELVERLASRGIVASARGNGLRVSFHAYNTAEDVDAVLDSLDANAVLIERAAAISS